MPGREQYEFGDVDIQGSIVMREGASGAAQGGVMVGVKAKLAVGLATIATGGVAVKNTANYTLHGAAGATLKDKGFTVNTTDDRIDVDFIGTKYCLIQGKFSLDVASGTDALVIQVVKNASVVLFESASQSQTAGTPLLFTFDFYDTLSNGDYVELYCENEDATANIAVAVYAEASGLVTSGDAVTESGYMQITGW